MFLFLMFLSFTGVSQSAADYLTLTAEVIIEQKKFKDIKCKDGVLEIKDNNISVVINTGETNEALVTFIHDNLDVTFKGTFNIYPEGCMIIDSSTYNNIFIAFNTGYFSITWGRFIYDGFVDCMAPSTYVIGNNVFTDKTYISNECITRNQEGLSLIINPKTNKVYIGYVEVYLEYDIKSIHKRGSSVIYKLYEGDMYIILNPHNFEIYNGSELNNN